MTVISIDPKWLLEFAPSFYRKSDNEAMAQKRRQLKLNPLYNKLDPEGKEWRISKVIRKGLGKVTF